MQGNGILVPDHDEQAIFDAILRILSASDHERDVMSKISQTLVEKYSSKMMSEQYMELYEKVCNEVG